MKRQLFCLGAVAFVSLVAGCNETNAPPPPPTNTTQVLGTQQVLAQAKETSETASPYVVNGGLVTITGTNENTAPIAVNAD